MTTSKSEKKVAVRVVASGEKLLISSNFHFCDNCTLNIDKKYSPRSDVHRFGHTGF